MASDREMCAYCYAFESTSVASVDDVLGAVAGAGRSFHHTDSWGEPQSWLDGDSCADRIQRAAIAAADEIRGLRLALVEACALAVERADVAGRPDDEVAIAVRARIAALRKIGERK